ncbi:MAG TPA: hypothetical protein VM328_06110, partial [Fimbriimonadaceae bacterium]|nr:hypothetical protein [Fimbriimonadaceae bacterium]
LIQAHNEVQGLVSMPFETYFYGFLETQNWKVDGWTGFFKIEVEGKGFYKIGFNMGSFTTSRRYMVSGALDQRVPIALISGLSAADSLKAGIYSVMTSQPMYAHVDSQFQDQVNESGPELDADCIEDNPNKRSSLAETRAKRDPENLAESAAYRSQYMRLEINPNTFTYKMRALGGTPSFLLSVSRTVDGKTTNSRTTGGIFDGLTYRDVPLVYGERAVFSGPIEDQGTYISGKLAPFELPYRRFRWKSAPPQKVTVKVSWEFIGKVGGQSPTIARMMEFTAKQLVAQAGAHGVISLPEIMGEADELAGLTTCEGVEVKTSGQLRHKKDGARP